MVWGGEGLGVLNLNPSERPQNSTLRLEFHASLRGELRGMQAYGFPRCTQLGSPHALRQSFKTGISPGGFRN